MSGSFYFGNFKGETEQSKLLNNHNLKELKKIGILTSGGDAPGMNAALRAVVRAATFYGIDCMGIYRGYEGIMENDIEPFDARSVNHILPRGGTVLKSARSKEFREKPGREKAFNHLKEREIDALVVIGGDGTFTGAMHLESEFGLKTIGIPGTIDNDLYGTDLTLGFDTACNTVIEAVDKIRDTAQSHNRLFFVEVMGRDSGFIAAYAGVASGAIAVIVPEHETTVDELIKILERGRQNRKSSSIVLVAEGGKTGGATVLADRVKKRYPAYETKVTILGHIQRGGSPTVTDRILASRMGVAAVEGLRKGQSKCMIGIINGKIVYTPFEEAISDKLMLDKEMLRIANILSI